jgi:DNA-binding LacI/PurR family transcriptional regulator/DNA-binding transcriptional regulator YhcF (GntR family)
VNKLNAAYEKLKKNLIAEEWPAGTRLPSLANLAIICAVSRATIWKVVSRLKQESLVHTRERGHIIAGPFGAAREISVKRNLAAPGPLWKRLAVTVGKEILSGSFSEARLPPISKLAVYYGVAVPTLHKSLDMLVADGIINKEGLRYLQNKGNFRTNQSRIVFISTADAGGKIDVAEFRTQTLLQSFEREAPRMGFEATCEPFNVLSADGLLEITNRFKDSRNLSGAILNIWNAWDRPIWQRWTDLITLLAKKSIPTIVADQSGNLEIPGTLLRSGTVRLIRISSVQAGIRVGEALHHRGHRRIAFISPNHPTDWAQGRYNGLLNYFERYGGSSSNVTLYTRDIPISNYELIFALLNLDEKGVHALHFEQYSEERIRSLYPILKRSQKLRLSSVVSDQTMSQTLRPMVDAMQELMGKKHDTRTLVRLQQFVGSIATDRALAVWMTPLFNTVLSKGNATAWVCPSDQIALAALSFLESRKIEVPGKISVIGFDNWQEAHEQQLSTFDFNMHGMIQEALLMIFDRKEFRRKPVVSEVDGYVVERRTTKK